MSNCENLDDYEKLFKPGMVPKPGPHLGRPSYYNWMIHQQDKFKNTGYDYEKNMVDKILSNYMLVDPRKEYTFKRFADMLVFLINSIGSIKKSYNYTVDRNFKVHT